MQQVDLVDDDETDELSVSLLSALSRDDVPFLRSANDDLRGLNGNCGPMKERFKSGKRKKMVCSV